VWHRLFEKLALAAVPEGREDESAADEVGNVRPMVLAHDVQPETEGGSAPGRRQHVVLINEQCVGLNIDQGNREAKSSASCQCTAARERQGRTLTDWGCL
jgi:hypothetical protein